MKGPSSHKRLPASCLLAVLVILVCSEAFAAGSPQQDAPAWSVNLHTFGSPGDSPREWPPRSWNWKGPLEPPDFWFWQRGISFTDDDTLAVYFVIQQEPTKLSVRGSPQPSDPFQLRGIFFDVSSGRVKHEQQWSTAADTPSGIFATHDGRFLVLGGQQLSLYSRDFGLLRQLSLHTGEGRPPWWEVEVSPTGQFLFLVRSTIRPRQKHVLRLKSDTLEQLNTLDAWDEKGFFHIAAGENTLARQERHVVLVRSVDGPWRAIHTMGASASQDTSQEYDSVFLDNQTILLTNRTQGFVLLSTEGKVLFEENLQEELGKRGALMELGKSQDGSRFAIGVAWFRGGRFDTAEYRAVWRVIVYDVGRQKRIVAVDVKPQRDVIHTLALSPNGQWLAVLVGSKVQVFRLPPLAER